jgi:hypothetical protein
MGSRISLIHQAGALRSYFPSSEITRKGENELTWVGTVTPTSLSHAYQIKLHYKRGKGVDIFVLEPKLKLADGKTKLPHVYSTPKQQLCLYYPDGKEWNVSMFYVKTLIPWACEWLYHYEIWVGTGVWHGGGIDHEVEKPEENPQEIKDE